MKILCKKFRIKSLVYALLFIATIGFVSTTAADESCNIELVQSWIKPTTTISYGNNILAVKDSFLYFAGRDSLYIFSISDSGTIEQRNSLFVNVFDILMSTENLYSSLLTSFTSFDITDPINPVIIDSTDSSSFILSVIYNNYIYSLVEIPSSTVRYFRAIDISSPESLHIIIPSYGHPFGIESLKDTYFKDDLFYVVGNHTLTSPTYPYEPYPQGWFYVENTSNLDSVYNIDYYVEGTESDPAIFNTILVKDSLIIISGGYPKVSIFKFNSDTSNLELISTWNIGDSLKHIYASEILYDSLLVLSGNEGVIILNIANPSVPYRVAYYYFNSDISASLVDIEIKDKYIYCFSSMSGSPMILVFKVDIESSIQCRIEKNDEFDFNIVPNPFNSVCKISMSEYGNTPKMIKIYNIYGQVIENISFTNSEYIWNSNNISSGIYIVSIIDEFSNIRKSKKVVYIG